MACGRRPTLISLPARLVAVEIGVTVLDPRLATKTVRWRGTVLGVPRGDAAAPVGADAAPASAATVARTAGVANAARRIVLIMSSRLSRSLAACKTHCGQNSRLACRQSGPPEAYACDCARQQSRA